MRVLIAIPCLLRGGTEMQTLALVKVLKSLKYCVGVICYFEYNESVVEDFLSEGAEIRFLKLSRETGVIRLVQILRKEFASYKPDILHVQYMAPGALPILAARLAGVEKVFATVHQPYTKSHGFHSKLILRCVYFLTTKFIAVSRNAEKSWFGSSSHPDDNEPYTNQSGHYTIYNAVDSGKINSIIENTKREELEKQLGISPGKKMIGIISRLTHEKGIDLAIEALRILKDNGTEVNMLIVGTGSQGEILKEKVSRYRLNGAVTFYGQASWENAMSLMAVMDIVIVPSRFEGFGLTAAEAMAAGKPVIASGCFGLEEIVVNKKTGLLFTPGNFSDLAEKLEWLIGSPVLCTNLGIQGKKRVESVFGMDKFTVKISSLYKAFRN